MGCVSTTPSSSSCPSESLSGRCSRKFCPLLQRQRDPDFPFFFTIKLASFTRHSPLPLGLPCLIVKASLLGAVRGALLISYLTGPLPETPEGDTIKVFYAGGGEVGFCPIKPKATEQASSWVITGPEEIASICRVGARRPNLHLFPLFCRRAEPGGGLTSR